MKSKLLQDLKPLFFPVRKEEANPEMEHNSWLSHEIIVETPGGPRRVNACSEDYTLVSNRELFTPIVEALEKEYDLEVKIRIVEWAKFYVDFIFKDITYKGATKIDKLMPRMKIRNSYDGSMRYSYLFGLWRLICSNGATAPVEGSLKEGKFMHTPQLSDDRATDELMKKLGQFLDNSKEIVRNFEPLIKHRLTEAEALTRMQEIKEEVDFPTKLIEPAAERLLLEVQQYRQPMNDYLVYNALNYALYQGESLMPEHKKDKLDARVLEFLLEENNVI